MPNFGIKTKLLIGLLFAFIPVFGIAASPSKEQVKVAYLYYFTKFVKWPAEAFNYDQAPLHICIFGQDIFGDLLDVLSKKTVYGRKIQIYRWNNLSAVIKCHVLFVSPSKQKNLSDIFQLVRDKPILTVGDTPGFAHQGGMINFIMINNTLRYEINYNVVSKAKLKISAAMLEIAKIIK